MKRIILLFLLCSYCFGQQLDYKRHVQGNLFLPSGASAPNSRIRIQLKYCQGQVGRVPVNPGSPPGQTGLIVSFTPFEIPVGNDGSWSTDLFGNDQIMCGSDMSGPSRWLFQPVFNGIANAGVEYQIQSCGAASPCAPFKPDSAPQCTLTVTTDCSLQQGPIGPDTWVTIEGVVAVPNALNFTKNLNVPAGSTPVQWILNGNNVTGYLAAGGATAGVVGATTNGGLEEVAHTGASATKVKPGTRATTPVTLGLITTCTSGQYLQWNGTAWVCATPGGGPGGTGVTSINGSTGAFTFSGPGVSCSGTNCQFTGGGGGGTLPPLPLGALFSSDGSGSAVDSGLKGQSGFLEGQVLTAQGDLTSSPSPFDSTPNASMEYFPQGYGTTGQTNGLALFVSHSGNPGAPGNGGIALAGGNNTPSQSNQIYLDCEVSGCDFKVPVTQNGQGLGGGGGGSGTVGAGTTGQFASYTSTNAIAGNTHLDDGNTTTNTITSTLPLATPQVNLTGASTSGIAMTSSGGDLPTPATGVGGVGIGPGGVPMMSVGGANWIAIPTQTGGGGGTAGVESINNVTGPFTFAGTGVSCASTTCTFAGGGASGVTTFNGRSGAVAPVSGDYSVGQINGAAPSASPVLTGSPTAPTPPATDNSTAIATTAWVRANAGSGGGGGATTPIGLASQAPFCATNNTTTAASLNLASLTVGDGETVLVAVAQNPNAAGNTPTFSVADNGTPTTAYTRVGTYTNAGSSATIELWASPAGGSHSATSLTINSTQQQRMIACVVSYRGVHGLGSPTANISGSATLLNLPVTTNTNNSVIFAAFGQAMVANTFLIAPGTALGLSQANNSTPGFTLALCQNLVVTAGPDSCGATVSNNANVMGVAVELQCCSGGGGGNGGGGGSTVTVNGASVPSPVNLHDSSSLTWHVTGSDVTGTAIGGGQAIPISRRDAECKIQTVTTATPLNIPLSIEAGDTVLVWVSMNASGGAGSVTSVTDDASDAFQQMLYQGTTGFLWTTQAGAARTSASVTINASSTGTVQRFAACAASYVGVHAYGLTNVSTTLSGGSTGQLTIPSPGTSQPDNFWVVGFATTNGAASATALVGNLIGQASYTTPSASAHLCENAAGAAGSMPQCSVTWVGATPAYTALGVELVSGATGGGGGTTPPATNGSISCPLLADSAFTTTAVPICTQTLNATKIVHCVLPWNFTSTSGTTADIHIELMQSAFDGPSTGAYWSTQLRSQSGPLLGAIQQTQFGVTNLITQTGLALTDHFIYTAVIDGVAIVPDGVPVQFSILIHGSAGAGAVRTGAYCTFE